MITTQFIPAALTVSDGSAEVGRGMALLVALALLLGVFFIAIVLVTGLRIRRRRLEREAAGRAAANESIDPWSEAGARLQSHAPRRRKN